MAKKKKQQRKKSRHLPTLPPEQERLLDSLLQRLAEVNGSNVKDLIPSPEIAQALIERLPAEAPESMALILTLRTVFDHKGVQKAVKKAVYRLKQKGVAVPESDTPLISPAPFGKSEKADPEGYLGIIDGLGNRPVLLILPQFPKGVDVAMGIINDELGIKEFLFGRYSRKRMKEVRDIFLGRFSPMVRTSLSHAATALENAYSRNQGRPDESVGEYLRLRSWILDHAPLLNRSPVHDELGPQDPPETLTASLLKKLLGHRFMASWILEPERTMPLISEISEAEQSPILVSEAQKANRIREIKEKAVSESFPAPKRSLLKDRLEEMAYVFLKEEDASYARICLAAATSLGEDSALLAPNPFLMGMLQQSLDLYQMGPDGTATPKASEEESPPAIIIP